VAELLSIEEALAAVLERAEPLDSDDVPLEDATCRVLAAPALAAVDLPPFPSSAMDGFALRAADVPGTLAVVGRIAAGRPSARALGAGEAMAISTGGVVPEGADTIVPIERVEDRRETVVVSSSVVLGDNVRPQGSDLAAGHPAVAEGVRLGPAQLGALAAAGLTSVRCARMPRVAVLVTGSELRSPGEPLGPGEIYDANGLILEAQIRSAGGSVERLPAVRDDEQATRAAIESGLGCDVLLTTGGVSVGVHDLVRQVGAALGVDEVFWGVSVRPGKPLAFGTHGRTLVFGLPGNPVSSLVSFELFVRPCLLALQGIGDPRPPFRPARLAAVVRPNPTRDSLLRARSRVDGDAIAVEVLSGQESHMLARAAGADALVLVRRGDAELPAGAAVEYLALA
jgi:molybdopterin molybdotransferase